MSITTRRERTDDTNQRAETDARGLVFDTLVHLAVQVADIAPWKQDEHRPPGVFATRT